MLQIIIAKNPSALHNKKKKIGPIIRVIYDEAIF